MYINWHIYFLYQLPSQNSQVGRPPIKQISAGGKENLRRKTPRGLARNGNSKSVSAAPQPSPPSPPLSPLPSTSLTVKSKAIPQNKSQATPQNKSQATPQNKRKATPQNKSKATPQNKSKATPQSKGKATKSKDTMKWKLEPPQKCDIRKFKGPQPGAKHNLKASQNSVLDFFFMMFPLSLFETMANETTRYAHQSGASDTWGTSVEEMRAFIAMNIMFGVTYMPRLYMYWTVDGRFRQSWFYDVMPINRFKELNRWVYFDIGSRQSF